MSLEFEIPLIALIFTIIINYVYFKKPKVKLMENINYEVILVTSLIVAIIHTIIHFICASHSIEIINQVYYSSINFANKILAILFAIIFTSFFNYVLLISYEKVKEKAKILYIVQTIFMIMFSTFIMFTNIKIIRIGQVTNVVGLTADASFVVVAVMLFLSLIIALLNIKKIDQRYSSIFYIIFLAIVFYVIAIIFPGILLYNILLALLCYIMFFTIENPDLKMIESLNIAKSEAERANLAKSDFLASMSHEIRTPLNAITGFSHAILEVDKLPQEANDYAKDIIKSSDTLLEIVGGVLDVSKIESNKMEIVEVLYNPREEFEGLVKIVKSRIGEKPIIFNYKIAEDIPYQLYGDRANIKKIVTNLLTNAVKYTAKGQIFFNVKCINKNDVSYLIISVQDTGMGIKEEHISKLFTKFERLEVEKNTTAEGTGLGLAITKKLVELMGGKINVKSQYGVGSIFMTQIPQRIAMMSKPLTDTQMLSTLELKKKRAEEEANINGQRILIVDDNALNIKVAKIALKNFNLVLDEVESGEECLEKINSGEKYDVILMDIMMPGMSGEETFIKLKEIVGFNTPVIALTADAISGSKEKYLSLGFTSYVSKPFSPDEIKSELAKIFK